MQNPHTGDLKSRAEMLLRAHQEIDSLLEHYVHGLLESHDAFGSQVNALRGILESLTLALVVYSLDGKVVLANNQATALIGEDPSHWTRQDIDQRYQFFKLDGCTPYPQAELPYEIAASGSIARAEGMAFGRQLPPEGKYLRVTAAPLRDADRQVVGVVTAFEDITELKQFERQRNLLATVIAHDLKNHLAGQDILLSMLGQELEGKVDSEFLEVITKTKNANQQFLNISNTFLELYRADLFQLESTRVIMAPAEILQAAVALNAQNAEAAGVTINLAIPADTPSIEGIPPALRQAFHNIIQNCIAASPRGSTIEIQTASTQAIVTITITDQGSGMPEDLVATLFDRRRAAASLPTSPSSTSFGLYLSGMIIEAHHGRISCSSRLGSGTRFEIELPVAVAKNSQASTD